MCLIITPTTVKLKAKTNLNVVKVVSKTLVSNKVRACQQSFIYEKGVLQPYIRLLISDIAHFAADTPDVDYLKYIGYRYSPVMRLWMTDYTYGVGKQAKSIVEGYHSFRNVKRAEVSDMLQLKVLALFIIPKGTIYYFDSKRNMLVSETIIFKKLI